MQKIIKFALYAAISFFLLTFAASVRAPAHAQVQRNFLPLARRNMISLTQFKQTDPRWASLPLGSSGKTVGQYGCTVTSLTMALGNYAINLTPGEVVTKLNALNGFMASGDLKWPAVQTAFPQVSFMDRVYTTLEAPNYARININEALSRIRRLIALGQPVLVNVDNIGADGRADHWIVLYDVEGSDFIMNDPATGSKALFSSRYGSPDKGIYGYTVLLGPAIAYPDLIGEPKVGAAVFMLTQANRGIFTPMYIKNALEVLTG